MNTAFHAHITESVTQERVVQVEAAANRARVRAFARHCFYQAYGANVRDFLPGMFALVDEHEQIRASMGFQSAADAALYLEHYLPQPVEQMIAQTLDLPAPDRRSILEVGNLASLSSGGTRGLILCLARYLHQQGFEWLVITATRAVVNSFEKLGIGFELHKLADAHPQAVACSASDWGRYYEQAPAVYVCNFSDSIRHLSRNAVVSKRICASAAPISDFGLRLGVQELVR